MFEELLCESFSSDSNYCCIVPKTTESGDNIIEWKGIKFMFENIKYASTVSKLEVDNVDKVVYLESVGQVAQELARLQKTPK